MATINPFKPTVLFHIETQMTGFCKTKAWTEMG